MTLRVERIDIAFKVLQTSAVRKNYTFGFFASDPLSVVVVTSEVVVDSWVDGIVVVQYTVQSVRVCTTLRRNGCGVITFVKTTLLFTRFLVE